MQYRVAIASGVLTGLLGGIAGATTGVAWTGGASYAPITPTDILWLLLPQVILGAALGFAFGFGMTLLFGRLRSSARRA